MACEAISLPRALHADLQLLAQSRRASVRDPVRAQDQAGVASQHTGTRARHSRLLEAHESTTEAVPLDQERGSDPREHSPLLSVHPGNPGSKLANFGFRSLAADRMRLLRGSSSPS